MRKRFQKCRIAAVRVRYLIIFNLWNGRGARLIETILAVHNTTVYRLAKRFREFGEACLWDGREDNGTQKLSETYLGLLTVEPAGSWLASANVDAGIVGRNDGAQDGRSHSRRHHDSGLGFDPSTPWQPSVMTER
jgi:hypothetical protein